MTERPRIGHLKCKYSLALGAPRITIIIHIYSLLFGTSLMKGYNGKQIIKYMQFCWQVPGEKYTQPYTTIHAVVLLPAICSPAINKHQPQKECKMFKYHSKYHKLSKQQPCREFGSYNNVRKGIGIQKEFSMTMNSL